MSLLTADGSVVNVMKQSGCDVPAWMENLPKLTKRDKRRIKQKMVTRKNVDAESTLEKKRKAHKRYIPAITNNSDIINNSKRKSQSQDSRGQVDVNTHMIMVPFIHLQIHPSVTCIVT